MYCMQVCGKVIDLVHYVQNEESRKSFRFLSHLPLSTVFSFLLLDFSEEFALRPNNTVQKELKKDIADFLRRREKAAKARKKINAKVVKKAAKVHAAEERARMVELSDYDYSLDGDFELALSLSSQDPQNFPGFRELRNILGFAQVEDEDEEEARSRTISADTSVLQQNQGKWSQVANTGMATWISLSDSVSAAQDPHAGAEGGTSYSQPFPVPPHSRSDGAGTVPGGFKAAWGRSTSSDIGLGGNGTGLNTRESQSGALNALPAFVPTKKGKKTLLFANTGGRRRS